MTGKVYLVGSGPGDPELLTLKAKRLIESAEVILYDQLPGKAILGMLPKSAERIDVGKYAGNHKPSKAGAAFAVKTRPYRQGPARKHRHPPSEA